MGLSDGERFAGVASVVEEMFAIGKDCADRDLKPLLQGLWFDFLGRSSNGMHWIMGSDSGATHLGEMSLLAVSFSHGYPESKPYKDSVQRWREAYLPSAECLLEGEDRQAWKLLCLCESYFYYANRYEDGLSKSLEPVTRTVATIRGLLHRITQREVFRCAWMMQHILQQCFSWDEDDIVSKAGKAMHWHHSLRADRQDAQVVLEIFKRHQFDRWDADQRLTDILVLMGSRFHYAHQHQQLLRMVEQWNDHEAELALSNEGYEPDLINEDDLRATLAKWCVEKKARPYRLYCHLTGQESS